MNDSRVRGRFVFSKNGVPFMCDAVVDTGAPMTFIHMGLATQLGLRPGGVGGGVRLHNGAAEDHDQMTVEVHVPGSTVAPTRFAVGVSERFNEPIVGMDVIKTFNIIIDPVTQTVSVGGRPAPSATKYTLGGAALGAGVVAALWAFSSASPAPTSPAERARPEPDDEVRSAPRKRAPRTSTAPKKKPVAKKKPATGQGSARKPAASAAKQAPAAQKKSGTRRGTNGRGQ